MPSKKQLIISIAVEMRHMATDSLRFSSDEAIVISLMTAETATWAEQGM
jgi:hypothetical protein